MEAKEREGVREGEREKERGRERERERERERVGEILFCATYVQQNCFTFTAREHSPISKGLPGHQNR